jgi:hypothetical protein
LGASLGIVSDILGKNQQLESATLAQALLILKDITAGISLGIQQLYQQ